MLASFSVYDDEDGVGMGGGVDGVDIVDCDALSIVRNLKRRKIVRTGIGWFERESQSISLSLGSRYTYFFNVSKIEHVFT